MGGETFVLKYRKEQIVHSGACHLICKSQLRWYQYDINTRPISLSPAIMFHSPCGCHDYLLTKNWRFGQCMWWTSDSVKIFILPCLEESGTNCILKCTWTNEHLNKHLQNRQLPFMSFHSVTFRRYLWFFCVSYISHKDSGKLYFFVSDRTRHAYEESSSLSLTWLEHKAGFHQRLSWTLYFLWQIPDLLAFPVFEATDWTLIILSTRFNQSFKSIIGCLVPFFPNPLLLLLQ